MRRPRGLWVPAPFARALACLLAVAGCSPAAAPDGASGGAPIALVYRRQCARCHSLPKPGVLARGPLEQELLRHRTRVTLTPAEWTEMVDLLAAK